MIMAVAKYMPAATKKMFHAIFPVLALFTIGFALSSGLFHDPLSGAITRIITEFKPYIVNHCSTLWVDSFQKSRWHYFLLPEGGYAIAFYASPLSLPTVVTVVSNALFNVMFQPLFPCVFVPQAIFNCLLFPFFLFGAFKYFKKIFIMLIVCLGVYVYTGIYGSVIEAIIRHRIPCELIYLLIGLAGFMALITGKSFS